MLTPADTYTALKRQARFGTNLLSAARQLEVWSNVTRADLNISALHALTVGSGWTVSAWTDVSAERVGVDHCCFTAVRAF